VLLAGAAFGRGPRGIVLVHESRGNVCQWKQWAVRLANRGYHVLAIDLRTYGESQKGPSTSGGRRFDRDVVAAARELRKLGGREVVLVGASMGGAVVTSAAPLVLPPPAGVVSLSGEASWPGIDPVAGVQRSQAPLLLVAGAQDDPEFAGDAQKLYDASIAPDKTIQVVDAPDHGVDLVRYNPGVRTLVEGWLSAHLP
jgi:dienelactone hydrolase